MDPKIEDGVQGFLGFGDLSDFAKSGQLLTRPVESITVIFFFEAFH